MKVEGEAEGRAKLPSQSGLTLLAGLSAFGGQAPNQWTVGTPPVMKGG